jgi:predicted lipoprotein with Yx(FWY)xxD motif
MSDPVTINRPARRPAGRARGPLAAVAVLCVAVIAAAAMAATTSAAEPEIPPVVTTSAPVATADGYTLKGTIYTYSLDTHYHFEYGTTTSYGTIVPMPDADAGTNPVVPVSQTVAGLTPGASYHFRIVAENSKGPGSSSDATFTASSGSGAPAPAPGPSPAPGGGGEAGPSGPGASKKVTVKVVKSKGKSILANSAGRTLYSLSVEKHGRFVCTKSSGCLAVWHPLLVPKGATVKAPVKLGTIKRPEGGAQAIYHGLPLYTFAGDTAAGQTKGQGIKDVGTWHAAMAPKKKH